MIATDEKNSVYEFPVSTEQSSFWMLNKMSPDNTAFNIPMVVRLKGAVDKVALSKAVDQLVARHEILRTRYVMSDGHLVQQVTTQFDLQFDARSFVSAGENAESEVQTAIAEKIKQAFDLGEGGVIRAGLLELSVDNAIFYLVVHHIAVDHTAMLQLSDELSLLYRAARSGQPAALPEPELQYVDYVMWAKEAEKDMSPKVDAWKQRLSDFSGYLALPLDNQRPKLASGRGAEFRFQFAQSLSAQVLAFSREQKSSVYQVVFSAFVSLLSRLSGQRDVVVGTPFTKRGELEELGSVVGNFMNTLPIGVLLTEQMSFLELTKAAKDALLFAFENQEVPLEAIVRACASQRQSAVSPIFQVGFVFQEPQAALQLDDLTCSNVDVHNDGAAYDLHVWMWEENGILAGSITYDTDIYHAASIERFSKNFQALLSSLLVSPNDCMTKLSLLSESDIKSLGDWNDTDATRASNKSLPGLFSDVAKAQPDNVAVIAGDRELSYGDLELQSTQMANYLKQAGVVAGEFVGVCISRSSNLLIGLLGVLKVGGVYVPIDPEYPDDRIQYMLEQSGVKIVLAETQTLEGLPAYDCKTICIDADWADIICAPEQALPLPELDALMYVIFTSGSTGNPKGVQITHGCVVNFLSAMARRPGMSKDDTLLAVTTLSFDISVLELFLPLVVGAKVVLASPEQVADGRELLQVMVAHKVTLMQATPSAWRMLIAVGWEDQVRPKVLCGGEAFPRDLAAELLPRASAVWNMYGPTETTVWSTCYQIEDAAKPIVIGQPIDNTQCYVLNDQQQLQAIGVPGELYIGGEGVAKGYLGRDDLTVERFIESPFARKNGTANNKLYRTGDMVRWRADGNLEYLNRIDNQVKVRGYRIELEEIEQALLKHEDIESCVVIASEFGTHDKRLVGYVKFAEGQQLTGSEVRRFLRDFLPEYMVIQHLVALDELPLTLNGKIDRKALPSPFDNPSQEEAFVEAANEIESALADIWANVLRLERVSANSYFFELGGHSVLALEVLQKIESRFGVKLSTQSMLMDSLDKIAVIIGSATNRAEGAKAEKTEQRQSSVDIQPASKTGSAGLFQGLVKKLIG